MNSWQKAIKYLAMAFAILLCVSIIGGILGAVGVVGLFVNGTEELAGEQKTYEISEDITSLDIDISAADLSIKISDGFKVETNHKNITVTNKNGKLIISEKGNIFGVNYRTGELSVVVYIPAAAFFEEAEIVTGAGIVDIEDLSAKELSLELGAGKVDIEKLTATDSADIDGGAGQIIISGGSLTDLDLDMGVGELKLTSELLGDCDVDCGVGAVEIIILGDADDYRVDIEKGIGDAKIDGKSASGVYGNGANKIDINGGIGKVEIRFDIKKQA